MANVSEKKGASPMTESTLKRHRTGSTLTTARVAEVNASLAEIDWRLLRWLLRYPLQRVDDLVVGVARWASRATVYRHMQELAEGVGWSKASCRKHMERGNTSTT